MAAFEPTVRVPVSDLNAAARIRNAALEASPRMALRRRRSAMWQPPRGVARPRPASLRHQGRPPRRRQRISRRRCQRDLSRPPAVGTPTPGQRWATPSPLGFARTRLRCAMSRGLWSKAIPRLPRSSTHWSRSPVKTGSRLGPGRNPPARPRHRLGALHVVIFNLASVLFEAAIDPTCPALLQHGAAAALECRNDRALPPRPDEVGPA